MIKPTPKTVVSVVYDFREVCAYVRSENPAASWVADHFQWFGSEGDNDLADLAKDVETVGYHKGAATQVAWWRSEFGDHMTVQR